MTFIEEQVYDEMPYRDDAYFHSQPSRLAAAALLLGLPAPLVETARVLELGCAGGGNCIPLAMRYPEAQFVGIDISGVQIDHGKKRIHQLGLKNIQLEKTSITDLRNIEGKFDYVIAHGVFSWVPEEVRAALLRIMHERLSDSGIAYMSYNVLPGWQLKRVARDIMMYAEAGSTNPQIGVGLGRSFLATIAACATGAYGQVVQAEATSLQGSADSYVRHDHMEPVNAPLYFRDLVALASDYGLSYLIESDPVTAIPECVKPESAATIRELGAGDHVRMEQYLDYCVGRTFRMSLFVKGHDKVPTERIILPEHFKLLHFSVRLPIQRTQQSPNFATPSVDVQFVSYKSVRQTITVQSSTAVQVMDWILEYSRKNTGTFTSAMVLASFGKDSELDAGIEATLNTVLLELLRKQMIHAYSVAIHSQAVTERPCADALIREDALQKRTHTVNLFHENVRFEGENQLRLLCLLDGKHTQPELIAALTLIGVPDAAMYVPQTLTEFARLHLLVG